jgi:peptidoglycan/LPS O-acetylase OafA/YrhL
MAFHWVPGRWSTVVPIGVIAVRVFFVLSGFLITGILLRTRRAVAGGRASRSSGIIRFYARRALRILPIYYLVIFTLAALDMPDARRTLPWHAAYATNLWVAARHAWHPLFGHLWSLGVEQQFYLAWPFLVLWLPDRWLGTVFVMTLAAGPVSRALVYLLVHDTVTPSVLPISCLDTLGAGALLAWWADRAGGAPAVPDRLRPAFMVCGAVLTLLALARSGGGVACTLLDSGVALLAVPLVAGLASPATGGRVAATLAAPPLAYIGTISYGAYVYHGYAPDLCRWACRAFHLAEPGPWAAVPWRAAITLALAATSWHLLERPLNDLKRHLRAV